MLKRSLSPAPLPPSKRLHTLDSTLTSQTPRTFDTLLYDEIILLIFSYLSFDDLCFAQSVNRNWSRLALDNQLWKSLYIRDYGKQRLRGGKGLGKPMAGREIKPLPGRALLPPGSEGLRDWKRMFKISSNWRTGRCQLSGFDEAPSAAGNPNTDTSRAPSSTTKQAEGTTHILLAGSVTICASSAPSRAPFITVAHASSSPYIVPVDFKNPSQAVQITALAIDQSLHSSQATRFVVCLSSGELVVYELRGSQARTAVYLHHYPGQRFSRRTHPILQAAYHHPLLFTLSESFSLSVYDATTEVMQLVHHLSSFSSFPPASLVLTSPDTNTYKLLITYSSPVYPRHWSLGVTEILMQCPPRNPQTVNRSTFSLLSTRSVRAFDTPPGWVDDTRMRTLREQWGRKVLNVAATNSDGKWVVLAPTEPGCTSCAPSNLSYTTSALLSTHPVRRHWTAASLPLQLYRVSFPSGTSATPKLSFVRYLYGQRSPVASLALADGRCVSLGIDGSVWAWDLETAGGVQVRSASAEAREEPFEGEEFDEEDEGAWCERLKDGLKGVIAFDERRIVSSGPSGVVVRDFDT